MEAAEAVAEAAREGAVACEEGTTPRLSTASRQTATPPHEDQTPPTRINGGTLSAPSALSHSGPLRARARSRPEGDLRNTAALLLWRGHVLLKDF